MKSLVNTSTVLSFETISYSPDILAILEWIWTNMKYKLTHDSCYI